MYLKTAAFAILNGDLQANDHDRVEAYQFVTDNGYWEELTPEQLLTLRHLIETDVVFTPILWMPL
jgi:hypothetical protein